MMLRSTPSLAAAVATSAAAATRMTFHTHSNAAHPVVFRRSAASSLFLRHTSCGSAPALGSIHGLIHTLRTYATTTPPVGNDLDDAQRIGDSSGHVDDTAANHHHPPTLRSAMPPSAVELPEESFLKCIDKEIFDEKVRLDKEDGPPPVPLGWTMHHTEGTSFIYGRRLWMPSPSSSSSSSAKGGGDTEEERSDARDRGSKAGQEARTTRRATERHFIRIQLTARDASLDPECDVRGEHFPFSFFVQRVRGGGRDDDGGAGLTSSRSTEGGGDVENQDILNDDPFDEHTFYHDSIEARCDVVDGELVVDGVVYHGPPPFTKQSTPSSGEAQPQYTNPFGGYPGPNLDEAEEEVLDGIQSWLAERGVDDQLGEFIGQYSIWVEQAEYERWLQQLRDYVAA